MPEYEIEIANRQKLWPIDEAALRNTVAHVLRQEQIPAASISVAIVDDPTIHRINREFLAHDEPTDVISFVLEDSPLEGELVISADTAARESQRYGVTLEEELALYVTHGILHLVGFDDLTPQAAAQMRARERLRLAELGRPHRWRPLNEADS